MIGLRVHVGARRLMRKTCITSSNLIVSARGDYLTEGHYWVKWVDTIEVHTPAKTRSAGGTVEG
jgi:hypothetical protein